MRDDWVKAAIKEVAKELGESPLLVDIFWKHQFKFLKDRMRELSIRPIRLPSFGVYAIKKGKYQDVIDGKYKILSTDEKPWVKKGREKYKKKEAND